MKKSKAISLRSFCVLVVGMVAITLSTQGLLAAQRKQADDNTAEHRALFNYQMFCQGCHVADGSGNKSVPELKGFIDKFMASQQGREYLIRVPGAANSALTDHELAEVMNWMLVNFGNSSNTAWEPYDAHEVGEYRRQPLNETVQYRKNLIASLKLESEL